MKSNLVLILTLIAIGCSGNSDQSSDNPNTSPTSRGGVAGNPNDVGDEGGTSGSGGQSGNAGTVGEGGTAGADGEGGSSGSGDSFGNAGTVGEGGTANADGEGVTSANGGDAGAGGAIGRCTGENNGQIISEGAFGECDYENGCAETGTQSRTDRVCADGQIVDRVVSQNCERDTEGTVVSEGVFGACDYADDCVETGTRSRSDSVCSAGVAIDTDVTEACSRATEGTVLSEGVFGACDYADDCVETGTRSRSDSVCRAGVATDTDVTEACSRATEGTVLSEGVFGACDYADDCVETGTRSRSDSVCRAGVAIDTDVTEACSRATEGTVLSEGVFGACDYADDCVETGTRSRSDSVCRAGVATDTDVTEACSRATEGTVLSEGVFGACDYADDCVETGTRSRSDSVCSAGVATDTDVTEACSRNTNGVVLSEGVFGACSYASNCDVAGTKIRTDQVCLNGVSDDRETSTSEGCERAAIGGWAECGAGQCLHTESDPSHCGACDFACGSNAICTSGVCECLDNFTGQSCDECLPNFSGPNCDQCAPNFVGPNCDQCASGFGGTDCDELLPLNYEAYVRQPGTGFTPAPLAMPLPTAACAAKPNQRILENRQLAVDCHVPEDTCVTVMDGAEVVCSGGATVDGILWIASTSNNMNTLLITDYIEVSGNGEFYVTGASAEQPHAQRAEIFLRHEYCGKPEDGFDATFQAASIGECRRKGKLQSFAGLVKIAGKPKTAWSLLTQDSKDSHAATPNLIRVDHCGGWSVGDRLSIAATGGNQDSYQGVNNWCSESDCWPRLNSRSELRIIDSLTEHGNGECDVILTEALMTNHRGKEEGIGSPMLRIQAEVVNHSRSVVITGGYQVLPNDPDTRVATRYDYSNGGAASHTYGPNLDQVPCRVCKLPDDPSAGAHDLCTQADACQVYDAEGQDIQLCGQDCSPIGMQGITTAQMQGGVMQMSHTEIEKCGRRELAEYCLHFHHVGDVQYAVSSGTEAYESYFIGNAVREGINKGITIHGTHHALVQSNVVRDHQGPGIYIEDGNELYNVVEENVVMCSEVQFNSALCKLKNAANRPETQDSDWNEVSGIYFLAPLNHTIGNRVFGYDNAMYVNVNTSGHRGLGMAEGKICTSSFPFGHTIGNVFHNNAGFGWYANTAFPMDLAGLGALELNSGQTNRKGTVTDWTKCMPFSLSGEDHSFNVKIEDHTEYFNDFSAGVYSVGDITLKNYTVYGGNKGLYWKTYRRGLNSEPLCVDCTFVRTSIEGPGGSALVEFKNSDFYRRGEAYQVNHHCSLDGGTGGLCASHYDFRTSRFFEWSGSDEEGEYVPGGPYFYSGVALTTTLIFTPDGQVLTHVSQNVGFDIDTDPRCQNETPYAGFGWYGCDNVGTDADGEPLELRIVRIYSPNRGELTVTNHDDGGQYIVPWTDHGPQSGGASAYGVLPYCQGNDCPNYMMVTGYVFSIPAGAEISLSFENELTQTDVLSDLFALEYGDEQMLPKTLLTIRSVSGTGLMDSQQPCTISSDHSRAFITPFGPVNGAAGAWYNECGHAWALKHTMQALIDQSYQGHQVDGHHGGDNGGGDNGGGQPNVDLTAEPLEPSPWSQAVHPDPSRVISLYTSIANYADVYSNADECRGQSNCSWPTWGAGNDACVPCNITWFPGWSQQQAFTFDYQLAEGSGQTHADRILKVELGPNWFSLFELPPNASLNLMEYDVLHFEVWSPGVTNLAVKARDYGPNQVWDAALDDVERSKALAFDDNLIPNQWSVIEINLHELFAPDGARNLGQLLVESVAPNVAGMPLYFSNIYFYKQ